MMAEAALPTHTTPVSLLIKGDTPLYPQLGRMSPTPMLPSRMAAAR